MQQKSRLDGLTKDEAQARLRADGPNELPRAERRPFWKILIEVVREPMLALLIGSGLLYLLLGDLAEAIILVIFALLSIVITIVQETRTEHVLEALRDMTSPRALVVRDGERQRIASREVVRGDLVVLSEGDRVPADARLVECQGLQTDESLLTGESVAVRKRVGGDASLPATRPGGDDLPFVFSGSLIVRGSGLAEVVATGGRSEIGRIGHSLAVVATEAPRLQAETRRIVRIVGVAAGGVCLLVFVLNGILKGNWLNALLSGIALGMAVLPEEFPVVLTIFLAMGAWRIARVNVLTRRPAAIETLGAATVLCTDKTGTLTENRMSVAELRLPDGKAFRPMAGKTMAGGAMAEGFRLLAHYGILATPRDPFDPMETALLTLGETYLDREAEGHVADWKIVHAFGLRPEFLAMTQVWDTSDGQNDLIIAAKGAPEAIFGLCRLNDGDRVAQTQVADAMAAEGLRVLGVARATSGAGQLPGSPHDLEFSFVGFVGLADALRSTVPAAVAECHAAGIRVVMITGDYPTTAKAIARQAGIVEGGILTGDTLSALNDAELAEQVKSASIFARIMPEQKLRIVNAFKANGEIVAMTGDGVNDAPSLKAAHIGIAMGGRGTDVAREAAAIVLLDDDFSSVVKAIRLGRRIYDNLRKAMAFIFAVHVPIAGLALLPLLAGLPVLLGPVHIAFIEMVIDPVCTLVFEAEEEESDIMRRAPRSPERPLISLALVGWGLLQGVVALVLVSAVFIIALRTGLPENEARALSFFTLVTTTIGLILVNRSFSASLIKALRRPGRALVAVLTIVTGILTLTLTWPFARRLFRFGPLHPDDLALVFCAGVGIVVVLELLKPLWRGLLFERPAAKAPLVAGINVINGGQS